LRDKEQVIINRVTRNISDGLISCPTRRSPGRTCVSSSEETSGLEAKPSGYEEGLRITGRGAQSRTSEDRRETAGRVKPGRAAIGRAQRTTYVVARFTVPSGDHILIGAILYDLDVGDPLNCARCAFEHLHPRNTGVCAAPDGTLESFHRTEVGTAEQNEIGIVVAEAHSIEIRLI